jgi:threonine/homoserine/homoserine lactone efflux protein
MFGTENYWGFILVGVLLNLTPGSDTIYILARSVAQGKKAGIASVLGINTGCLIHTLMAALGLSLILRSSATLFMLVKYAGAGYLVYLGIKMLAARTPAFESRRLSFERSDLLKIYWQGILTNVLNPKVALFFLSFLPQFIDAENAYGPLPFLILGGTFTTTSAVWCLFLAYASSIMTNTLRNNEKVAKSLQKLSGTVFIMLGLQLALKRN